MIIDQHTLDYLTAQAKESPRLRMNLDLRNSPDDQSQRMLNAIEPGTVLPIHRHRDTSETVVCLRGHFEEYFYDVNGQLTDTIDMVPGGTLINIPADNRDLNYDKYFKEGDTKRATIDEFNSDNTYRLNLEETKAKIASLEYIQNELNGVPNVVK